MKQIHSHSKNSLFLMEMIFVLLFLSLSSAACIRIFAAAEENHVHTVENRQIQAHTVSRWATITTASSAVQGFF